MQSQSAKVTLKGQSHLLNLTHDTIFVRDMNDVIAFWNRGAEELYGWTAREAVGKMAHELLKTGFPVPLQQIENELLRTGRWEGELVHTRKFGTPVVVASRWSLERDHKGLPIAVLETNNDISERKRAEEALRRSEAYLAEAQRLSHTGSWAYNPSTGRTLYWSDETFRIFGLDPQRDASDREDFVRLLHPEDREKVLADTEKAIREKADYAYDHRIMLPDGTVRYVHVSGHPVIDQKGEIVEYVGTTVDVTERKRAEDELRASEARYRTFVDFAADPFLLHRGEDGSILDVNQQACDSLGYTPEELIGMPISSFDACVSLDAAFMQQLRRRLDAGETFGFETSHRRKDGTVFPVEVRVRPFWHDGRYFNVSFTRDITERKRAEEELRKAEAAKLEMSLEARVNERTRIARELHDTLLQSFQGLMLRFQTVYEMLPERPMDAKKALEAALDRADQAISEGRDAITDIRTSTWASQDLAKSISALMTNLSEELSGGNGSSVRFRIRVEGAPRTLRPALQDDIYRIARESLRNAFCHAQARHIEAEITYADSLRLRFRDDGKGIDPSVLKHGGRSRHWGLPGIRERANHIGAQLEVWSELGAGTEIELSIPGSLAYEVFPTSARLRLSGKRTEQDHEHRS